MSNSVQDRKDEGRSYSLHFGLKENKILVCGFYRGIQARCKES